MYRSYTPAGLFLVFSLLAKFKGKMHLKYLSLHFSWHYWLAWVVHNCQIKYNKNSFTVIRICSFWMQPFLSSHNSFSSTAAIVVLYLPYTLLFFFATLFLIKARCLFIYLLFHWSIRFFKKIKLFQEVFKNMKCCTILWWVRYASYLRFILHKRVKRFVIKYKWLQIQFGLNKQCKRHNTRLMLLQVFIITKGKFFFSSQSQKRFTREPFLLWPQVGGN